MGRAARRPYPMILIVVQMPIRADRRDEWLVGITRYTDAVRHEPEGPEFECFQSIETPDAFLLVEAFASRAAGERHVQTDHFKEFMTWLPTVIAAPPRIINVEVPGGWSAMAELGQS
jgi:quinol monooxygenase YgiN